MERDIPTLLGKLFEQDELEPDKKPEQEKKPESPESEQGTIAAFLEGRIHESFTVCADKLFQMGLMNRGDRIGLSSAIGDALEAFRKSVSEKTPDLTTKPMDPVIAQKMTLKENHGGKKEARTG